MTTQRRCCTAFIFSIRFALVLLFYWGCCFFPVHSQSPVLLTEGKCHVVLKHLQKQTENDSIAVKTFFDNYVIIGTYKRTIVKNNPDVVIRYFNRPEQKATSCCLKDLYHMRTLLDSLDHVKHL